MDAGIAAGLSLLVTWFITQIIFIVYVVRSYTKIREEIVNKGRMIPLPTLIMSASPGMSGVCSHSQTLPPEFDQRDTPHSHQPPPYKP